MQSYISIENLAKSYGVVTAVNNINLGIEKGEFFSLLGPRAAENRRCSG